MCKRTQISLTESLQARPKRRRMDCGAGVKIGVQANCLKDLFFILNPGSFRGESVSGLLLLNWVSTLLGRRRTATHPGRQVRSVSQDSRC